MKLTYIYQLVDDLEPALAFYRDELGLQEAWREGDTTAAFELPGTSIQLMLDVRPGSTEQWTSGAFFGVDDVDAFAKEHPGARWLGEAISIPGGKAWAFADPGGNVVHVFDQAAEES